MSLKKDKKIELGNTDFERIFNASLDLICIAHTDGYFKRINPAFTTTLGHSEADLLSQTFISFIHPDDVQSTLKIVESLSQGVLLLNFENRYRTKMGDYRRISWHCRPNTENGELFAIGRDITSQKEKEREAEKLTAQLKEAQTIAKIGSWNFDLESQALVWSSEHYKIFEINEPQPSDKLYQLYRERIHPEDLLKLDKVVREATMLGKNFTYDHRLVFENGRTKHVRGIGRVEKNVAGKPIKISGTCQDLTEHLQKEEENRFILDTLGIGVWKFNPVNQSLWWDASMYRIFDINEQDFSGHYEAWESTLTPEAKEKATTELGQALRGEKEFNTVFEIQTKSRGNRYISGVGKVIRDKQGQPIMMYGINADVTDKRLSEIEAEKLSHLLKVVLENVPSMIFVKNAKENLSFTLLNKAGETLLGLNQSAFIGKNDYDFFPKDQADFFTQKDRDVFKNHQVLKIEKEEIATPKGKRFLYTQKVPIYDKDGHPDFLIGISNDITEELKAQEALDFEKAKSLRSAKLASLGEMSAGIAHEINNPIAIVLGTLKTIPKYASDSEKLASKLLTIEKAALRVEKIVGGLKKFSRSSEKSSYQPQSLKPIIDESLILTGAKSQRHSVPIEFICKSDSVIFCDEIEIEQILVNLINNGIDAVKDQNEKWIKILLFEDAEFAVLQIRDSGRGIPVESQSKLFQPFFTTKPVGKGTGLGLSIVKGILDEHKATIEILPNDPNTCFEIHFRKVAPLKRTA